jgi:hypothetical protein
VLTETYCKSHIYCPPHKLLHFRLKVPLLEWASSARVCASVPAKPDAALGCHVAPSPAGYCEAPRIKAKALYGTVPYTI